MGCWTIRIYIHIYIYRRVYFISLGGMEAMKGWRGTRNYYPYTALKLLPRSFRGIEDMVKPTYYDLSCQFPEAGISRGEARKSMTRVTPLFGFPFLKHRRKFNLVRLPRHHLPPPPPLPSPPATRVGNFATETNFLFFFLCPPTEQKTSRCLALLSK